MITARQSILTRYLLLLFLVFTDRVLAQPSKSTQSAQISKSVHLSLPKVVYVAVGIEANIYFENAVLVLNPASITFDVTSTKGRQQAERWTWIPTEAEVGDHTFVLEVRDDNNGLLETGQTTIRVVSADPNRARSLLLIGDSLTHVSIYSQHLLDLTSRSGNPNLTLIGSHCPESNVTTNRHEGYGGWTAQRFATHFAEIARQGDYKLRGSPFLYRQSDGTTKLDFQHYCQDVNQGTYPDAVTIFLGPNDVFSFNDDSIDRGIETMLAHVDRLIEMIKASSPSTRIGILLPVPPAASQDAFGSNYGTGQTRWQYRRNQHALVQAIIKRYSDRVSNGIDVVPTHLHLDCGHNYPTETTTANARTDEKVIRQNNGVHPSAAGYRQIGDAVFGWLRSLND